ncbi:MAG: ABC transporter permease, partial [Sedimentisphaerales bacterium]|nr:ABC transporter permease [Sedimentisphaerales bacterium]
MNKLQKPAENIYQKGRSLWSDALRRLRRQKLAMISFVVITFYVGFAGFIYLAESLDWNMQTISWEEETGDSYQPPSVKNVFGTDIFGRSVLRKTLYGVKISITVALCASFISLAIGVPLGAIAGYFRGVTDDVVVWIYSTLSSVPYILLVLAFAVVLQNKTIFGIKLTGITTVYLAIGLTSWVGICRLIRGEIIKRKESDYVLAARSYGCPTMRIIFKHLLPNVFHIIIINFSLRFVGFIHAEVILSFLGLGETDRPSWGAMINDARIEL